MQSNSGTDYVKTVMESLYEQNQNKYQSPDDPQLVQDALIMVQKSIAPFKLSESRMKNNLNRINRAEGGIMDLGGMEKDYRAEGGFVPIGREEKADDVPARLSVNEFVFTADAVRNAGGGDIDKGAEVMENMMKHLEQGGQVSDESQGMAGAQQMFETSERLSEVI
jgi:RNA polymerase-interacting CarD/CdnL/TRCF family regulator